MTPDYSPAMLRAFLKARIAHARNIAAPNDVARRNAERGEKVRIRMDAKVSDALLAEAIGGRLTNGVLRTRIWGALGIVPTDLGIRLTDDGGQVFEGGDP